MYTNITNPKTGRKVSINSSLGKNIIRNYLNYVKGGAAGGVSVCVTDSKSTAAFKRKLFGQEPFSTGPFIQFPRNFFQTTSATPTFLPAGDAPPPVATDSGGAAATKVDGGISFLMHKIPPKGGVEYNDRVKSFAEGAIGAGCKVVWECTSCEKSILPGVTAYTWWQGRDGAGLVESHCQLCVDKFVRENANEYLWSAPPGPASPDAAPPGAASPDASHKGLIILNIDKTGKTPCICRIEGLDDTVPTELTNVSCKNLKKPSTLPDIGQWEWTKLCEFLSLPKAEQTFGNFKRFGITSISMQDDNMKFVEALLKKYNDGIRERARKLQISVASIYGKYELQLDHLNKVIAYMKRTGYFNHLSTLSPEKQADFLLDTTGLYMDLSLIHI